MSKQLLISPKPSSLTHEEFVDRFGGIYECSVWVAEKAFLTGLRPEHDTPDGLADLFKEVVEKANINDQLTLLRAHPELIGKLSLGDTLSAYSKSEQASAGLYQCTAEEFSAFQSLNAAYQMTFGFPFIIAVRGKGPAEILQEFQRRSLNSRKEEIRAALDEVHKIGRSRLAQLCVRNN